MRVQILFFGVLKEIFGGESEMLELKEETSVAHLKSLFEGRVRGREDLMRSIAVAVNRQYAQAEDVLCDGDEVALLPPVSGGLR